MSEQTRVTHPKEAPLPTDVEGFDSPAALALDRRSSGNHATDPVWRQSEPVLWKLTHTPWVVLHTGSREKPRHDPADPAFRTNIDDLVQARREAAAPAWLQQTHAQSALSGVAYSSRESMSSEDLPICSGGLGNAAGDQLPAMTGIEPEVCRLNEGDMALAVPECARFPASGRTILRGRLGCDASGQSRRHPHGGGRRLRPFRVGSDRTIPRRPCRAEARHNARRFAGAGPPASERPGRKFHHGVSGDPRKRGGE